MTALADTLETIACTKHLRKLDNAIEFTYAELLELLVMLAAKHDPSIADAKVLAYIELEKSYDGFNAILHYETQ